MGTEVWPTVTAPSTAWRLGTTRPSSSPAAMASRIQSGNNRSSSDPIDPENFVATANDGAPNPLQPQGAAGSLQPAANAPSQPCSPSRASRRNR